MRYTHKDANTNKHMIKTLRHWDWVARNLGFKPHMSKFGGEYTKSLIARKVISLPADADGVRCRLELANGGFSLDSLKMVVGLLK